MEKGCFDDMVSITSGRHIYSVSATAHRWFAAVRVGVMASRRGGGGGCVGSPFVLREGSIRGQRCSECRWTPDSPVSCIVDYPHYLWDCS
jgi:hypothetical protein